MRSWCCACPLLGPHTCLRVTIPHPAWWRAKLAWDWRTGQVWEANWEGCSKSRGIPSTRMKNGESILPHELGGWGGTEGSDKCLEKPGWCGAWHEGLCRLNRSCETPQSFWKLRLNHTQRKQAYISSFLALCCNYVKSIVCLIHRYQIKTDKHYPMPLMSELIE